MHLVLVIRSFEQSVDAKEESKTLLRGALTVNAPYTATVSNIGSAPLMGGCLSHKADKMRVPSHSYLLDA